MRLEPPNSGIKERGLQLLLPHLWLLLFRLPFLLTSSFSISCQGSGLHFMEGGGAALLSPVASQLFPSHKGPTECWAQAWDPKKGPWRP